MTSISRRSFLRSGAALIGAAGAPAALQALAARQAHAGRPRAVASPVPSPYGEPILKPDLTTGLELIALPPDFTYRTLIWAGDAMSDGTPSPTNCDGMAVVQVLPGRAGDIVLIRNHELSLGPLIGAGLAPTYDPAALGRNRIAGGTTTLTFRRGELVASQASLAGTLINCAGGPTPWGSWLSCEETINDGSVFNALLHGFVFEVPAPSLGPASAVPITDMGLFKHEACAVDPRTGFVYETEDATGHSGFYRFRPNDANGRVGSLEAGGALEMLRVVGQDGADLREPAPGDVYSVAWVPIDDPTYLPPEAEGQILYDGPSGPYAQALDRGGATFHRLEGCWYHQGSIWFTDTTGGADGNGVVWRYEPATDPDAPGVLEAFFVAESSSASNNIDNLTISPRGGIVCCEDGGTPEGVRLVGFTRDGASFPFAVNQVNLPNGVPGRPAIAPGNYRSVEWAGACFDPSGRWLFANIYRPGITVAITGPWARGPL